MPFPSNTVDSDAVAQDQIRSFVERIMRMREEAKAINDDIREIYAEAKGNGFDKTILGKLVLYVEKRGKDEPAVLEQEALFDLYLEAFYERPSRTHAHEGQKSTAARNDVLGTEGKGPVSGSPDRTLAELGVAPRAGDQAEPGAGAAAPPVDTISETHDGEPSETLGTAAEPTGEVANDASPAPARMTAADNALSIRPYCLHADDLSKCAGQGRKHCWGCQKAHADAEGLSA